MEVMYNLMNSILDHAEGMSFLLELYYILRKWFFPVTGLNNQGHVGGVDGLAGTSQGKLHLLSFIHSKWKIFNSNQFKSQQIS